MSWKHGTIKLLAKPQAKDNPKDPKNFRPIALTSCIGKIFTSILKDRWSEYMAVNNYMSSDIQKAFCANVPGCSEHQMKLWYTLSDAKSQQKSVSVCWIDLANAYGSVSHQLIRLSLLHYHAPPIFQHMVQNLYNGLSASVATKEWSTSPYPINLGIFQGDPLSVIIFNTVINLYVEYIQNNYSHLGYYFTGSDHSVSNLQYADDTCLVASSLPNLNILCRATSRWIEWARMAIKVPKCRFLSLHRGCVAVNHSLSLAGVPVPSVIETPMKFLGSPITANLDTLDHRSAILSQLSSYLLRVDSSLVSRRQKLKLYNLAICSRISWNLSIHALPLSWIERSLDSLVIKYLKKWAGLAKPANSARLFITSAAGGLGLKKPSMIYQNMQLSRHSQFILSSDSCVRFLASKQLKQEESQFSGFHPASLVRNILSVDPGASRKHLKKHVAAELRSIHNTGLRKSLQSLAVQGSLVESEETLSDNVWGAAMKVVPEKVMKFGLNAVADTLPHRSNLVKWRKVRDAFCPLCNGHQSLLHILNHCQKALELRRYTERHDEVLKIIATELEKFLPQSYRMSVDHSSYTYYFPEYICPSEDQRPDIVIWSDSCKKILLVELTVCFEHNYEKAANRKKDRYSDLASNINAAGYDCSIIPVQVGSRGYIDTTSFTPLKHFFRIPTRTYFKLLTDISSASLIKSYSIWINRNRVS